MIFPFKVIISTDLEEYKTRVKDTLQSNKREKIYKVKFFWKLLFIWYWGNFELTAENHQGKNYYVRRHVLTIGFIKKRKGMLLLKGINLVNILDYFLWFLFPFIFSIIDGDLLKAILLSLAFMVLPILIGFDKDSEVSKLLVKKLYDNNE